MTRQTWPLLAMLVLAHTATAQLVQQGSKLTGANAAGAAFFGSSVAISADGSTAIVGGSADDLHKGAAWVFTRNGGAWSQQGGKLVGSDAIGAAYQGCSVAVSADGSTALVGGYNDDSGIGAAWVFARSGGVWSQQGGKLVGAGTAWTAFQGASVAISADGDTTIIGGPGDADLGAAWVFTRTGGVWTQQGDRLVGSGASPSGWSGVAQGTSVAISADGTTAIVGGPGDDGTRGAAWVFTRSGNAWTQRGAKLVGTGADSAAEQGRSVALSADGSTAIVGSDDPYGSGGSWVFTRAGNDWMQQGERLVGSGAVGTAYQGFSVTLSADGDLAAVGGEGDAAATGATWVFGRSTGAWTQQGDKLVASDAVGSARQGFSAAISADGGTIVVGGPYDAAGSGAAWVFASSQPRLAFVTQPSTSPAGQPLAPPVAVQLEDAGGSPVAQAGATVTMSLSSGTGTLAGTLSRATDGSGLATFSDLVLGLGGPKQLKAASAGRIAAISSPFTIEGGSQVAQSIVLSDESGRLLGALASAGYGGYTLDQVLVALRQIAEPTVAGFITDQLLSSLAACPAGSQVFATRVGDVPAGGSVAISTDCTVQLGTLRGATYLGRSGTATLVATIGAAGEGLFTHASDPAKPLVSWRAAGTTYQAFAIAWARKLTPLRKVIPRQSDTR